MIMSVYNFLKSQPFWKWRRCRYLLRQSVFSRQYKFSAGRSKNFSHRSRNFCALLVGARA